MPILSKRYKPDNFESLNSLKLIFTNIQGLHSNCVDCESLLKLNFPYILALCVTNLDNSTDSGNFSMRSYLPLIQKNSTTHMHGLAVYRKIFELLYFTQCLTLFSSIDHRLLNSWISAWRILVFQIVGKFHWWFLYLRILGKDL